MEKQFLRRAFALLFICMLAFASLHAEAFKVKKFRAELQLDKNGVLTVKEIIDVVFSESKHGIVRKLPYRYSPIGIVNGEIAEGHEASKDYFTPIREVFVEDKQFSTQENGFDLSVKIGSANEYVTGEQQYVILYKVYGVINRFKTNQEFYWNVNGNDWDVTFEEVEAELKLPDNYRLPEKDIRTFNGYLGDMKTGCQVAVSPGKLQVNFNRLLMPKEGVTFVARFPQNYFKNSGVPLEILAKSHVMDTLKAVVHLNDSGFAEVEETIWLRALKPSTNFERVLNLKAAQPMPFGWNAPAYGIELLESSVMNLKTGKESTFRPIGRNPYYDAENLRIEVNASHLPDSGNYLLKLRYIVWNTVASKDSASVLFFPWMDGSENEPVGKANLQLNWDRKQPPQLANLHFHPLTPRDGQISLSSDKLQLDFKHGLQTADLVNFYMEFPELAFDVAPSPMRLQSPDNYIKRLTAKVKIDENARVHYDLAALWLNRKEYQVYIGLPEQVDSWSSHIFQPNMPQSWGYVGYYLIDNLESNLNFERTRYCSLQGDCLGFRTSDLSGTEPVEIRLSYDIYGTINKDSLSIALPLFDGFSAPIEALEFELELPQNTLLNEKSFGLFLDNMYRGIEFFEIKDLKIEPGHLSGKVHSGILAENSVTMLLELPANTFQSSFWLDARLFLHNHHFIIYPFIYALLLGLLWFLFGRDKKFPLVVQFYPPEGLDPVDAGVLIDAKLDDRDIMALIYWWGARGLLSIEEIYGTDGEPTDYKLTKLGKLPETAKSYEKTLFNGLFSAGNVTKILDHRNSFHHTLAKVRREIAKEHASKRFFVPGTDAWMKVMKVIGWLLLLAGGGLLFLSMANWGNYYGGRMEIPAGLLAMAALTFIVRKQMPRKTPFGQEQFEKLAGFEEFLIMAEKDKLEELVNTNPDYFGLTLPYAIALGLAGAWTDRFGPLLTSPPSYYRGSLAEDRIREHQFDMVLQRQLGLMVRTLNSVPAASRSYSSSSGSSYRSSSSFGSSSRSYSSSGSSGSSGFSSRGGYSGGGYGGGGGSSW